MAEWKIQERVIHLPDEIAQVVQRVNAVASAALPIAQTLRTTVELVASLSTLNLDAAQLAIKAAVSAAQQALADLQNGAGLYVLVVPPARRPALPQTVREALDDLAFSAIPGVVSREGGNAGFVRTVTESLADTGDVNRPQLGPYDFVEGGVLLAGASALSDLRPLLRQLRTLFGPLIPNHRLDVDDLPCPQELRARCVIGHAGRPVTLLTWKAPPHVFEIPVLDQYGRAFRFMVIRSADPKMLDARTVGELFGPQPIGGYTQGMKGSAGAEVVAIVDAEAAAGAVSGADATAVAAADPLLLSLRTTYRDDAEDLKVGTNYYYAVAFQHVLGTYGAVIQGKGEVWPFDTLSSVESVPLTAAPPPLPGSTPPNWRSVRPLQLIPGVSGYLDEASLLLEQFAQEVEGEAAPLKLYAEWLSAEIARYIDKASQATQLIQTLSALLGRQYAGGVYYNRFATTPEVVRQGRGGNVFILDELTKMMSEPGHPPFERGDEYVVGLVMVAGAPSPAVIEPVKRALDTLFGQVGAEVTAINEAAARIQGLVTEASKAFSDDLQPIPVTSSLDSGSPSDGVTPWLGALTSPRGPAGSAGTADIVPPPATLTPDAPPVGTTDQGVCAIVRAPADPPPVSFTDNMQPA